MNTILWAGQAILAAVFLGSGIAKSTMSKERLLATGQTGAAAMPTGLVRFVAICEIFGAVGVIVPWWLGIHPVLTPLAALGFAIIMAGAAGVHFRIHEYKPIITNAVLFCLSVGVAYGRW